MEIELKLIKEHQPVARKMIKTSSRKQHSSHVDRRIETKSRMLRFWRMFCMGIRSKKMNIVVAVLFTILTMLLAILIIYFTAARPNHICKLPYKRTMKSALISSSQPRSVALGDLNNDDRIDFVVANSGTNTIGIFISNGNGTFINKQSCLTGLGSHPQSIVISHVNNDSYADLIVANYGTNNIGIFLGYGNGLFAEQNVLELGSSRAVFVTVADFHNDNRMDIAAVNNDTNTMSILFGYGNGSFSDQINYSTGYDSSPSSLAVGDFNNDTYLDIVVTNSGTNNIGIFLNYGNGTFKNQQIYTTNLNSKPSSVAVGNLNNDKRLDIAVANYNTGTVSIFFGFGNGTFLSQIVHMISSNAHPQYITISDIDKDSNLDIIIVDSNSDKIHVLPGYGNGSFARITTYDGVSGSKPIGIAVTDFNHNERSDVVVINYGTSNVLLLLDYFSEPSARQTNPRTTKVDIPSAVAISDFNNDRILDIVFSGRLYIGILIGVGNETYVEDKINLSNEFAAQYICTGDLNSDNRMDMVVADKGMHSVDVFLGYGNGTFSAMLNYSTGVGSKPCWVTLGDINNDKILDIVSASIGTNTIGIHLGYGNGTFAPITTYFIGVNTNPYSVALGDINNDDRLDMVVVNGIDSILIFLQEHNSSFIIIGTYSTGVYSIPFSIALADFNKDSHLDIVVANLNADNIGIFLGYGNGTFTSQIPYFTGNVSQPYYVLIADFSHDNISDIAVSNLASDEIIIFYGYQNGSFELKRRYSTGFGSEPYSIAAGNLNNDNNLEIVTDLWGAKVIAILTEYNAMKFINKTTYTISSAPQPYSVTVGDFNNDNRSDIVVANSGTNNLDILFGLGDGNFESELIYSIGTDFHPQYVISCDINQDNRLDIVNVNSKMNSISVIIGNGNGSFESQLIYRTGDGSYPYAVVAGDLNNDQRLDLVIANRDTNSIGLFFGFYYTNFRNQTTYSHQNSSGPCGLVVSDFNNDHFLDIAVTFYNGHSLGILLGYGNSTFIFTNIYTTGPDSLPYGITVGDLNNDNRTDIVVTHDKGGGIGVFLGYGNGSFAPIVTYGTANNSCSRGVDVGDVNKDGWLDIIVANLCSNNIGVFLGHGNGTFLNMTAYSTGEDSKPHSITINDFNNDGRIDVAVANHGLEKVGLLFGYDDGTFSSQVTFSLDYLSRPWWIVAGDFNRDNHLDLAIAGYDTDYVSILLGYGNGSFTSVETYSAGDGSTPFSISVGDFNNDNILDIAAANYGTNNIVVLFGFGDGTFLSGTPYTTGMGSLPSAIAIGDFNNDSRLDIAVANYESNTIGIFLGYDSQPFGSLTIHTIDDRSQPHSVALGDFNNDTWLDIVIANYGTNNIGILFGRGHRRFSNISLYPTGDSSAPYSVAIANFNNDTYLDIVVSNSETDNIIIFLGNGNGTFPTQVPYFTGARSRPYTVIIADFNNDNRMDIAVANSGTSNILLFHGYGNGTFGNQTLYLLGYGYHPYSIAVQDLDGNGSMDIIIACYDTDHVEILLKIC